MPSLLRALNSRNYRIYFAGQLVSLAGTWMQQIAMVWLAYRLTGSALMLGAVGFATQIPILVFGALGGVITDRFDKRRLLMATQILSLLQALLLALLAWLGLITPAVLLALAFGLGVINALDIPTRQSLAVQLVDQREDLPNAIALNSMLMNVARFVGPALAGFVVAALGEAVCFLLNGVSYLAVLLALTAIRLPAEVPRPAQGTPLQALREGLRYVGAHPRIRASLVLIAATSFLASPYLVLMPLFAREILGGDARLYGLLVGCAGAGSLASSVYLASRRDTRGLTRVVGWAAPLAGVALVIFALSAHLTLTMPVLFGLGIGIMLVAAGSNTLIQTQVDNAFRGRVMALFTMALLGVAPLGSFAVGSLAHHFGVRATLVACGLLTVMAGRAYQRHVRTLGSLPAR
ncbi:MFS transporter [Zoogloea sp.]|uniref:MFS transporter n=1 Tax=Zoogloea sp. TaxID=49181 RepID=UPI002631A19A|nr:MFS transporter [Zoogloea sp.]MDD3352998.1 MFS transporter [Zoogloea sp.]